MYKPLEYIDEGREVFPRSNPPRRRVRAWLGAPGTAYAGAAARPRFVSYHKGPDVDFAGLRVKVALIRDPAFDKRAMRVIRSASDASAVFSELADDVQEGLYVMLLDASNRTVGIYEAHRGTLSEVAVTPADVVRPALVAGVPALIVAHNHPSGVPQPSPADRELTVRVYAACEILGLKLLDHIVLSSDREGYSDYYSFADHGLLTQ